MKLRARLYIVATIVVVAFAGFGILVINTVESSEIQQVDLQLRSALPAGGALARPTPLGRPERLPRTQISNQVSDFYVARIDSSGRHVIVRPVDAGDSAPITPTVSSAARASALVPQTVGSESGGGRWRAVLIRGSIERAEILVAVPLTHVDATISRLRLVVLAAGLFLLLVLTAAVYWVARLGLRPIAEVTEVADAITSGDRSRRVRDVPSSTEAGHLATAFNVMLDEQQAIEDRLRQFVADASHELRTPVSAILGLAGLWRQGALREPEARDDAIRRIGQEATRMAGLVEDLLLLARLDEGRRPRLAPVDLAGLVSDVVAETLTTYPMREIEVHANGVVMAEVDDVALRQMIVNLVTNAVKHTPAASRVEVSVRRVDDSVVLVVTDSGPGMDSDGATHAFDRFWRAETSRTRAGTGLGLPIVAGIVAAHGGRIDFETSPERGTRVTVVLPVAGAPRDPTAAADRSAVPVRV